MPAVRLLAQVFIGEIKFLWESVHVAFKEGWKIEYLQLAACTMLLP